MKTLLPTLFFSFFTALSFAQTGGSAPAAAQTITITGTVIDSANNKPMGYVTVAIQDSKTHIGVKSGLTKDDGTFSFKAPAGKIYEAVLVFVGYRNKTITINGNGTDFNVGRVSIAASSSQLKEVSVTAARPLMKQEVDRISYDIQADPDNKALSVLDMMRKVPLLTVDGNDNIQLKGSGNYKILINGKESALVAKNPSDILKSMPATNIEKIEVITTPPAKYDAEGLAGIINIVTKKNADQGYNIGFNSRFNTVFGAGYNINGTVKQGKFGASFFGGFGSNGDLTVGSGNIENIFNPATKQVITTIDQIGTTRQKGNFHYGGAELSYEIDTLNLLTASVDLFGNDQHQYTNQLSNTDSLGILTQAFNLNNSNHGTFAGFDASFNYQLGFKKSKDELLTFSYKYSYSPNKQFNDNLFSDRFKYPLQSYPDYQQYNNAGDRDHTIQVDYASPLNKKISIEAGAKAILRSNYSYYHVDDRDTLTQQYISNEALTNNFTYHQNILSLYNSYQLKMDKWTGKAGLRLEHTGINADFTSAGVTTAPSYNNLIPSISVQRSFKSSSINFGYTQRIQRPVIFQLNPFVDKSNPTFINTGNPALKPELDNTFELTYSNYTKNSINIGLSYAFSNNSIQNVSSLRRVPVAGTDSTTTVTYTTFENLGANKTLGLNVHTNINLTKQFSLGLNGQVNHVWLSGSFNGGMYRNDGFTGHAFGNLRYKFDNGFAVSFNAGYFSGNVNLQGSSSNFIFNQYLLSKDFLNKKLTLVLVANNPYTKFNTFRNTINSTYFYQESYNQNYYRSFAFRVNFKFGKFNGNIKKNEHGIENDDTKGGNKSSSGNGN